MMVDLPDLPNELCALARAIADGTVSSEDAVRTTLARAEAAHDLNAFVALEAESALALARQCDRERQAGSLRGPLHGVPLAHKDMFFRAGLPTEAGAALWRGFRPEETSPLVARLEGAGAITFGRLHMAEFALGPTGHNVHLGRCGNPWHAQAISGGSSSGSAAAVGAGILCASLASDTGGSARVPAAFCGVSGLKPTTGLLPTYAMMELSRTCDTAGPIATSSRALALLMTVLAANGRDYMAGIGEDLCGLRIGLPTTWYNDGIHPEIDYALEAAAAQMRALGATLVDVAVPDQSAMARAAGTIALYEGARVHARDLALRPGDFGEDVRARLARGSAISESDYGSALALRHWAQVAMRDGPFANVDLLLTPATRMSVPLARDVEILGPDSRQELIGEISELTRPASLLGFPALVTPMGFDTRRLPLALQLIGPPHSEARLLRTAHAYEQATRWRAHPHAALARA